MDSIYNIRIVFTKKDRARFISHLDLSRCVQRAIKRARIPIWYTEGFNSRAYIMFPLALPLGISSGCEIMDFKLIEEMPFDEIKEKLNLFLPDGLNVVSVGFQNKKHTEIAYAEYKTAIWGDYSLNEMLEKFKYFLALEKIEIDKMSKKKIVTTIDIKPQIELIDIYINENKLFIYLNLPVGAQENLNINTVFDAFQKLYDIYIENIRIERTKILCANGESFC